MRRKQILPFKSMQTSLLPHAHPHTQSQAAPFPHQQLLSTSLLFSLFSAQIQCLVSMDFCVNSLKDIHWNGHIYRITNVLKAGGAIIVVQKPPIFGASCCHPVRLCFALPCYCTNFSAPLLWAAPAPALSAEA